MESIILSFVFFIDIETDDESFDIDIYEERINDKCQAMAERYVYDTLDIIEKNNSLFTENFYKYMKIDSGLNGQISYADETNLVDFEIMLDDYIQDCIKDNSNDIETIKHEIYETLAYYFCTKPQNRITVDNASIRNTIYIDSDVHTNIECY